MKLFVWIDPYQISYGTSRLIVVAETLDEARKLALSELSKKYHFGTMLMDEYYQKQNPLLSGSMPLGAPTRVVDLPCAEWDEWSE